MSEAIHLASQGTAIPTEYSAFQQKKSHLCNDTNQGQLTAAELVNSVHESPTRPTPSYLQLPPQKK